MSEVTKPRAALVAPATSDSGEPSAAVSDEAKRAEPPTSRRLAIAAGISGALGVGYALFAGAGGSASANPSANARARAIASARVPATVPRPGPAPKGGLIAGPVAPGLATSTAVNSSPEASLHATSSYALGGPVDRDASAAMAVGTGATRTRPGGQYASFSAAAAAATLVSSPLFNPKDFNGHLLRRATFGPTPADVANLAKLGIDRWLTAQLSPTTIPDPAGDAAWAAFPLAGAAPAVVNAKTVQYSWDAMFATAQGTLGRQIFSSRQLYEIVVDIFEAHLHVPLPSEQWNTAPDYIKNVIRKYAFGKYRDMLQAAMKHPAMLDFLSNDQSNKVDVNENLGRELLELHTVGISAGYTETDVRQSANILSGRTINGKAGTYLWNGNLHVTGPVTVLGFSSTNATAAGGEAVGDAYLNYLATHRGTALNIARKIATRFVSDAPSQSLVNRLADVYLANDTSIVAVVRAVFLSSDFWNSVGIRMRRPIEDAVGAARVLNVGLGTSAANTASGVTGIYWNLWNAGDNPLGWNEPNGYADVAAAWLGAGSMIQRWNGHRGLVYGWNKGLTYTAPLSVVKLTSRMTFGQWVDAVSLRLIGRTLPANHRAAVLTGIGHADTDVLPTWNWTWNGAGEGISLILDSAYFQLR